MKKKNSSQMPAILQPKLIVKKSRNNSAIKLPSTCSPTQDSIPEKEAGHHFYDFMRKSIEVNK
jgi:hypothetical protein